MLYTVLYVTHHPIQLAVIYGFFMMGVVVLYRSSLRQDDFMCLVELKDTYTKNHSVSVGHYSVILGQMLGLSAAQIQRLSIVAQLHDVGKIGIPDEVLKKQSSLSEEEYAIIKNHAAYGEQVLQPLQSMKLESEIIGRHHERIDGKGYPYQAKMDEISLESRIISITDAYHAIISHRPYQRGLGVH